MIELTVNKKTVPNRFTALPENCEIEVSFVDGNTIHLIKRRETVIAFGGKRGAYKPGTEVTVEWLNGSRRIAKWSLVDLEITLTARPARETQ